MSLTIDFSNVRAFNEGASNYYKREFEPWDFWIRFKMNPFDADILKRILRDKSTDPRLLEYKKVRHVCQERLRQLSSGPDCFSYPDRDSIPTVVETERMLHEYTLSALEKTLLFTLLYPSASREADYVEIIGMCSEQIADLESKSD